MEFWLKINGVIIIIQSYIKCNLIMSIVAFYIVLAIAIQFLFSIDLSIPCLWRTLFHVRCPGCGLTNAFIKILSLNISGAYTQNALIFILLPVGGIFLFSDMIKFKNRPEQQ